MESYEIFSTDVGRESEGAFRRGSYSGRTAREAIEKRWEIMFEGNVSDYEAESNIWYVIPESSKRLLVFEVNPPPRVNKPTIDRLNVNERV